jgi:hypothetical protein
MHTNFSHRGDDLSGQRAAAALIIAPCSVTSSAPSI